VRVVALDHIVLAVADVERSLSWYREVVGLEPVRVDEWRAGKAPFPSVRIDATTIIDLVSANGPLAGSGNLDHFCVVCEVTGAAELVAWAAASGLQIIEGPDERFGARGIATSIYVKDPDGNTVEFRHYRAS
jgi:catechol 2,3-dioxygenase-like lactoylglutathione lyase family enzyme